MWLAFVEMVQENSFFTNFVLVSVFYNTIMIFFMLKFNKFYILRNIDAFSIFYYGEIGLLKKNIAVETGYIFLMMYNNDRLFGFLMGKKTFPYLNDNKIPRADLFPNVTQEGIFLFKKEYIWMRLNIYVYMLNIFNAIVLLIYYFLYLY